MKLNLCVKWTAKPFLITALLFLSIGFVQAQNQKNTIKGSVTGDGGPLMGASVLVDGVEVFGRDNKPVLTDQSGKYVLSVPIGKHYLSIEKNGHQFTDAKGKGPAIFPGVDEMGYPMLWEFVEPITGMNFVICDCGC